MAPTPTFPARTVAARRRCTPHRGHRGGPARAPAGPARAGQADADGRGAVRRVRRGPAVPVLLRPQQGRVRRVSRRTRRHRRRRRGGAGARPDSLLNEQPTELRGSRRRSVQPTRRSCCRCGPEAPTPSSIGSPRSACTSSHRRSRRVKVSGLCRAPLDSPRPHRPRSPASVRYPSPPPTRSTSAISSVAAAVGASAGRLRRLLLLPDLHAITVPQDPKELRQRDPSGRRAAARARHRSRAVDAVRAEPGSRARRAGLVPQLHHRFRRGQPHDAVQDKSARQGSDHASVGLFHLPVLMAADILLYRPQRVPVGEDQRQHLELARDLAAVQHPLRQDVRDPEPQIIKGTAKIYDLQDPTSKMSKSGPTPAASSTCSTTPRSRPRRSSPPSPTTSARFVRSAEQARREQPAHHPVGTVRQEHRRPRCRLRGQGYGRPQGGHTAECSASSSRRCARRSTATSPTAPNGPHPPRLRGRSAREVAARTLGQVYEKVGFLTTRR